MNAKQQNLFGFQLNKQNKNKNKYLCSSSINNKKGLPQINSVEECIPCKFNTNYINKNIKKINKNKESYLALKRKNKSCKRREFKCQEKDCHKIYRTNENLKLHYMNHHLGQKPYECNYCSRRFSHRNGKTYHERVFHMNYLPYKCEIHSCSKKYANKSSLSYHLKFHHKIIRFLAKKD